MLWVGACGFADGLGRDDGGTGAPSSYSSGSGPFRGRLRDDGKGFFRFHKG